MYIVTEDLKKGSYVIQGKKKNGTADIKIVHGNRLRIYKVPNVGWKLSENYKKTALKELENEPQIAKKVQMSDKQLNMQIKDLSSSSQ